MSKYQWCIVEIGEDGSMNTYGPFPSGDKAEAYKRALIDYAEEDAELIDWTVMLLSSVD